MINNETNILRPDEIESLWRACRLLTELYTREQARSLWNELSKLLEEGCFNRDRYGLHRLVRQTEVATIAYRELHLDTNALTAILLYRSIYKELRTAEELRPIFGDETVRLIDLLIQTSALYSKTSAPGQENFHHLLLATGRDIRVILRLVADRLYLLRIAGSLFGESTCLQLADEVQHLYIPLTHKLGLYKIKSEMEDLCLKYTDRRSFNYIKRKLGETKRSREAYIAAFIAPLEERIAKEIPDISFSIKGRTKSIRSILNKLQKQNIPFENIYDLFAIRVVFDCSPEQERSICWRIYSTITDMYMPNPKRLKDWVSIPKSNGYESLHTTVMGPSERWVEVQIRSKRMDDIAERGVAAHWRYKGLEDEKRLDNYMANVRETLESVRDERTTVDAGKKSKISDINIYDDEIYVFTPKGKIIKLPRGATVLDFAYAIHSKVGSTATGARLAGRNVSIRHKLQNGDVVEVITSASQRPKSDWLQIVASPRSKNSIRSALRAESDANIAMAKEQLQRRIKNRHLPYIEGTFTRIVHRKGYKSINDFYLDIEVGKIDINALLDLYAAELQLTEVEAQAITPARSASEFVLQEEQTTGTTSKEDTQKAKTLIIGEGLADVHYTFASCCQPIFGDNVFGFASTQGIKIHRTDCPNAPDLTGRHPERVLPVAWNTSPLGGFRVRLSVVGRDDISVVSSIASIIKKETGNNISRYSVDSADGLFKGTFTIEVASQGMFSSIIRKIKTTPGIKSVSRL